MTKRRMRLGLSVANFGYHYAAWRLPESRNEADHDIGHHLRNAEIAERGLMDFLFFADLAVVRDVEHPTIRRDMEQSHLKLEPSLVCSALAACTSRIGLVPTMSTTFNQPYNLARRLASIDHISNGRMGWNLVTSTDKEEAANFGLSAPLTSEQRHARAREFAEVVRGLWDSWDDDAFMRDKVSGRYFDRAKVHFLNHEGTHFNVRGPLDTARPPQGQLPIITAGASANAQELAAEVADMVYSAFAHFDMAQNYYASVKGRLAKYGRCPDSLRIMAGIMPIVGHTREEAQAKFDRLQDLLDPRVANGMLLINQFPDMSAYGPDDKVPDMQVMDIHLTAARDPGVTARLMERARREGMTMRQLYAAVSAGFWHLGVIGTPTEVADTMQTWFEQGAADGFVVQPPYLPGSAEDFVDMVIPELQRRGLFRTEYEGRTLRQNLGLPVVPSRYAA
ncbi:MAG: LLM class flavin-dependent oxidoreductase [Proteobacteria bacterium]|nr:LLM class flavin-dependent oxidoreductase [Pseudomonadota bacterium]